MTRRFLLILALALAACDAPTAPVRVNLFVAATSRTSQEGYAASIVDHAPTVIVTDGKRLPARGVSVTFSIVAGGGSVEHVQSVTDANGLASAGKWTLGASPGDNTMHASAGQGTVSFHAAAVAAGDRIEGATLRLASIGGLALPVLDCVMDDQYEQSCAQLVNAELQFGSGDYSLSYSLREDNGNQYQMIFRGTFDRRAALVTLFGDDRAVFGAGRVSGGILSFTGTGEGVPARSQVQSFVR